MENKKSFGTFICQRRKELGMTQKEFAQRLFVTDSAVSKWERGLSLPDVALLTPLSEALGVGVAELLRKSCCPPARTPRAGGRNSWPKNICS